MEGDEIIQRQVSKFQKISCDGGDVDGGGGGGVGRLCGWPSSRIVRVSRASGGKDRHSKVLTSKGLRDRRIRLSVTTAIEFYDLQDRLGYDQPSKAVDWLIKAAASSIDELPSLDPSFNNGQGQNNHHYNNQNHRQNLLGDDLDFEDLDHHQQNSNNNSNSNSNNKNVSLSKSSACSSTSETSKGSGLSLSRSENRIRARERARDLTAKKEKEKESVLVPNTVNSSFTDLLTGTGGITSPASTDYFQMPHFNLPANNHPPHHQHHQFSFLQENFAPVVAAGGAGGESYNLNFSIPSSSSSARGSLASGLNRGTLQSNLLSTWPHHLHLQRYPAAAMADGSATNFPFSITPDHFQANGYGGGDGGGRHSDYYKGKSKN